MQPWEVGPLPNRLGQVCVQGDGCTSGGTGGGEGAETNCVLKVHVQNLVKGTLGQILVHGSLAICVYECMCVSL